MVEEKVIIDKRERHLEGSRVDTILSQAMRGGGGEGRRERMEPDAEARRPKVQKDRVNGWII